VETNEEEEEIEGWENRGEGLQTLSRKDNEQRTTNNEQTKKKRL
jgi:hypothetical protein